jgi:pseudouridine-5'-phosphate glycosidase
MTSSDKRFISIISEVDQALRQGEPIVALESTLITHGLPYPQNHDLVKNMEHTIREKGCIPATIAILDGLIHVGLDSMQLERLARAEGMRKISVRDISPAVALKKSGGTTVAATLAIAGEMGIKVFATGGIGGVHRQAPFDVSADLGELAKARLVVVCAGAKAILDIPATLEVLETNGVPVIGYQTDEFPAFYSLSSGLGVSARVDSVQEVADLANAHWGMGLGGCVLVAVPPPSEVAMQRELIESAIQAALQEAQRMDIHGQGVTPFLLGKVNELTGGASLRANLGLLVHNAGVAAEIARFIRPHSAE